MPQKSLTPHSKPFLRSLRRLRGWLNRWQHLAWGDRLMIMEALVFLGLGRATVLFIPFKRIAPHLGEMQQETPLGEYDANAQRVARAIYLVSRHTPWNSNCFAQALVGHVMLRRRHVAGT